MRGLAIYTMGSLARVKRAALPLGGVSLSDTRNVGHCVSARKGSA